MTYHLLLDLPVLEFFDWTGCLLKFDWDPNPPPKGAPKAVGVWGVPPNGLGLGVCGAPKAAPEAAGAPNRLGAAPDGGMLNIPPANHNTQC